MCLYDFSNDVSAFVFPLQLLFRTITKAFPFILLFLPLLEGLLFFLFALLLLMEWKGRILFAFVSKKHSTCRASFLAFLCSTVFLFPRAFFSSEKLRNIWLCARKCWYSVYKQRRRQRARRSSLELNVTNCRYAPNVFVKSRLVLLAAAECRGVSKRWLLRPRSNKVSSPNSTSNNFFCLSICLHSLVLF